MNRLSLRFRLISWYAALLLPTFAVLALVTHEVMRHSLSHILAQSHSRRARELAHLLTEALATPDDDLGTRLRRRIDASFAPAQHGRFARISRPDGTVLYQSPPPADTSFDLGDIPPPQWPATDEHAIQLHSADGHSLILAVRRVTLPDGRGYLVESAGATDLVHDILGHWTLVLTLILPALAAAAILGAILLVRRALRPVDDLVTSAERISSRDLSHRLPEPATGDELQRLAVALNHMLQRLESALQHSRRFVADASHELRTPLSVIRLELETALADPDLHPASRDRLGSALDEVARLGQIVDALFDISRLDAGEATTEWVRFDLAVLASGTTDQLALLASDQGLQLACNAPPGLWIEGDRSRIKQVIVNLLDNALKYTPPGGRVTLRTGADNDHAWLEVADTGIGIPSEALPRIFDRFYRVDKARSRQLGGGGLGLSIVQAICTAHRGRIQVSSALGQGTTFRVELPLASAAPTVSLDSADKPD